MPPRIVLSVDRILTTREVAQRFVLPRIRVRLSTPCSPGRGSPLRLEDGVAINSAPTEGVRRVPLSQIRSSWPVLKNLANRHKAVGLTR